MIIAFALYSDNMIGSRRVFVAHSMIVCDGLVKFNLTLRQAKIRARKTARLTPIEESFLIARSFCLPRFVSG
jgi:hypothetical protein